MEVRIQSTENVGPCLAIIKAREAPIDAHKSISLQIQVITMNIDRETETNQEETNQSFFNRLHQFTRHFYAPLARSARLNVQVMMTIVC